MSKKLSEYTLGEMQKICCGPQCCSECIFFNRICRTGAIIRPTDFMLSDIIFFTSEEIETAKTLARCFGEDYCIHKEKEWIHTCFGALNFLNPSVFPTLGKAEQFKVTLKDIIANKGLEL